MHRKARNQIQLLLEKNSYGQADVVKGVIVLTIVQQTAPDYLNLKLKVKEETKFQCEYKKQGARMFGKFRGRLNWFNHK